MKVNRNSILHTIVFIWLLALLFSGFTDTKQRALFQKLDSNLTGIGFRNTLNETDSLHVLNYEYLYNGNGIGVGDFNNDGLQDIFISGNTVHHGMYLNKGGFRFEDITEQAGVRGNGTWATGVCIADVNADGLMDIYVCHSGKFPPQQLANELFINKGAKNGIPTFSNEAKRYGLDAPGTQSTQAAFFDYDLDGDLDMFLLNHSVKTHNLLLNTTQIRSTPHLEFGNRLFRNDSEPNSPKFTEVTREAGIVNNAINYGLSVTTADLNGDGWADIYTTSDYSERDYCYINNGNGTFREILKQSFEHISQFSMGADIADYNNDARPDVITLDMLPEDNARQKLLKGAEEYDQYHLFVDSGYHHQNMRNMLHLNQGFDEKNTLRFSEIGQLAGVSNTDWSWAALFCDFDNDGWKDLFVSNGYLRDYTNLDFLKYTVADARLEEAKKGNLQFRTFDLVKKMPATKTNNYIFRNNKNLTFGNVTKDWGLERPAVSNASVYADFDNDGDMDLLISHLNEPISVYKNLSREQEQTPYLQVVLRGEGDNTFAIGAKILLETLNAQNTEKQLLEVSPVRGYQSSVDYTQHFGLPRGAVPLRVTVYWTDGKISVIEKPKVNTRINISQKNSQYPAKNLGFESQILQQQLFQTITKQSGLDFKHTENDFIDYKSEVLLPYQLSRLGPALDVADVNGDGLDDVFLGNALGSPSLLYLQQQGGSFRKAPAQPWNTVTNTDILGLVFFDADTDGDKDLYLVCGGNEAELDSTSYQDHLFLNDGKGVFTTSPNAALPTMPISGQAVSAADIDGDGDLDLFVGGRTVPGRFPLPERSYLLRNDTKNGNVKFTDVTREWCESLLKTGNITSALWFDENADGKPDLLLAGEWQPLKLYRNTGEQTMRLKPQSLGSECDNSYGMWSSFCIADLNNDGKSDIVAGNCGLNNQFKPTIKEPMSVLIADLDNNGTLDPIVTYHIQGQEYPMHSRDELLDQVVSLKKKFLSYKEYSTATLNIIVSPEKLKTAERLVCNEDNSVVFMALPQGGYQKRVLPVAAQFSKVQSIICEDVNNDTHTDILIVGNFFPYKVQLGKNDASLGLVLAGDGKGNFTPLPPYSSGLYVGGDVRAMKKISIQQEPCYVIVKNNEVVQVIKKGNKP